MHIRDHLIAHLVTARGVTDKLIDGMPDDALTHQTCPTDNHALWTMGHLAGADCFFGGMCGAKTHQPDTYQALFGMKSKPGPRHLYPPVQAVRDTYKATRAALLDWLRNASDADLCQDLREKSGGFVTDPVSAMMIAAWHEGWHGGQIASIRKALGLPPVFG